MTKLAEWYRTPQTQATPQQLPPIGAERLIAAWLDGLSPDTVKNYRFDLDAFAKFLGAANAEAATRILLQGSNGDANLLALEWKNDMLKRGFAPASVNRRLSALRSFTRMARRTGMVAWQVEFDRVYTRPYKDTRGPGLENVRKLLAALRVRTDAVGFRDAALFRLLYERGLRLKEVQGLDLEHVDVAGGRVFILGKWRREREWVSLAPSTTAALQRWISVRGRAPGPLFVGLGHTPGVKGRSEAAGRMSRQAVYRRIKRLGLANGIHVRPHGLRHSAITAALDSGLDVRTVARFARHVHLDTIVTYDDARRDFGRQVTCAIAEPEPGEPVPAAPSIEEPALAMGLVAVVVTPHSMGLKRGEASSRAKLTTADVIAIRMRYAAGERPTALGREFGVTATNVHHIVRRLSWRHVS